MPRGVRWAMQDVTAADANCRLDQMSVIRLTVYARELTRNTYLQMGTAGKSTCSPRTDYRSKGDELMRSNEVTEVWPCTVCVEEQRITEYVGIREFREKLKRGGK